MAEPFLFDRPRLKALASRHRDAYRKARPFPHVVLDDFPGPHDIRWINHVHPLSKKLACNDLTQMGDVTRTLLAALNSAIFVEFLEELTAIEGLVPDPWLDGGGLHQIESGGLLGIHADFNWHEKLKLDRRLNLLVYLNPDWTCTRHCTSAGRARSPACASIREHW